MMMEITRKQFVAYEKVRQSGLTNMFAVNTVCDLSGLEREEVKQIMQDYSALKEKYPLSATDEADAQEMRAQFA